MPRPRMTDRELREKALRKAIERAKIDLDLKTDLEVSTYLGIPQSTYSKKKQGQYHGFGFDEVYNVVSKMRFTVRELCDIFDVRN